ncbi:MAG: hypothetical protein MUF42_07655 [Cytophagaceae bacterium]|jgi:hypothetical protein|nr:hypothetical protein [Cytophagaceae bacterium]
MIIFQRIVLTALLGFTLATIFSSCKKEKESPEPEIQNQENTKNNPEPSPNSIYINKELFLKKQATTFDSYFNNTTYFQTASTFKIIYSYINLPSSNPASGYYSLEKFTDSYTYPGKNKASIAIYYGGNNYKSISDSTQQVQIINKGDSIEVIYKNITLKAITFQEELTIIASGRFTIGTKTPKPFYTGNATFTFGTANKVNYEVINENHEYEFKSSTLGNFSLLKFIFKEKPTTTKTYTISTIYPTTTNEVYIDMMASNLDLIDITDTDKTLSVTANSDGSISLSFSNVAATRKVGLGGSSTNITCSGNATMTQQ